jgi:PKD repeat protein
MKNFYSALFITIILNIFPWSLHSQISRGGMPPGLTEKDIPAIFQSIGLPAPDVTRLMEEDAQNNKNGRPLRIGIDIPVSLSIENSGTWTQLPGKGNIRRLGLSSQGAKAMNVTFSKFFMPASGLLYLYNLGGTKIIGAFSEDNNSSEGIFATELIPGDSLVLEYYEPDSPGDRPVLEISGVSYVYRDDGTGNKDFTGVSDPCEVNINCPEGINWQEQKQGVARIYVKDVSGYFWCSGSLVNNTRQDQKPYLLTANHCAPTATAEDFAKWVFYFNYEAEGCENPGNAPGSNTMTGATLMANADLSGSDFILVLLDQAIPVTYSPYFNGWSIIDAPSPSGVTIHHPAGDIKKISTYTTPLVSSQWGSTPGTHWEVVWATTLNGHGVTEGGSSGAPLFDNTGHIVGTLTGGLSACDPGGGGSGTGPDQPDYFGKFFYSWESNGSLPSQRLKDWLDPDSTGIQVLDGFGPALKADFRADATMILSGESITFTNFSSGGPSLFSWQFDGGEPSLSTLKDPPEIKYLVPGTYNVTLIVTKGLNSDTLVRTDYIRVVNKVFPNPSRDKIQVYLGKEPPSYIRLQLFNSLGLTVFTEEINNNISQILALDVSGLAAGVYFLRLEMDKRFFISKVSVIK